MTASVPAGLRQVYRAKDTKLRREVALEVVPEDLAAEPENLAWLERDQDDSGHATLGTNRFRRAEAPRADGPLTNGASRRDCWFLSVDNLVCNRDAPALTQRGRSPMKKLVPAWLTATITAFALSLVWYLLLMADFYADHGQAVARAEPDFRFIILGYVALGLLMAIAYPIVYKGGSPIAEGFRFGALFGLIWILPWSLIIVGI